MAKDIFIPKDVAEGKDVIRVGGKCYERVGPSQNVPDSFAVEKEYVSCEDCEQDFVNACVLCTATSENAIVTGFSGTFGGANNFPCSEFNVTLTDFYTNDDPGSWCMWAWSEPLANSQLDVELYQALEDLGENGIPISQTPGSPRDACLSPVMSKGEWLLNVIPFGPSTSQWLQKTVGFSCNPETGKVSGSDVLAVKCYSASCNGPITVTVPA